MASSTPDSQAAAQEHASFAAVISRHQDKTLSSSERAALTRLFVMANADTGQSKRVADFLLAWWNAERCGGFDLTSLWCIDESVAADLSIIFLLIARVQSYPDTLGFEQEFTHLIRHWRPQLAAA